MRAAGGFGAVDTSWSVLVFALLVFGVGSSTLAVSCCALSVTTRSKECNDGDNVVAELVVVVGLGVLGAVAVFQRVAVNHEPCASLVQEPLHEVDAKTA